MADEADKAQLHVDNAISAAVQYRKPVPNIHPIGLCHWCEEDLEGLKLFCDGDCATRYNRYHGV
jgi:hypothetical protein